jgi:hypothetical protein
MHRPSSWFLALVVASIGLAACSGGAAGPTVSSPPISSASASTLPSVAPSVAASLPPASGQFSFGGGFNGAEQVGQIECNNPTLAGPIISIFGQSADASFSTLVTVESDKIFVRLDAGQSTTYTDREFTGPGVTNFEAAKGGQVDSRLTESASLTKPGSLRSVVSIKGSMDCGNQVTGSSTLVISGTVTEGALSGPIDPVRVECAPNAQPPTVHISGLMKIGATPVLVILQGSTTVFSLFTPPTLTTKQHSFLTNAPTITTLTPTGAHLSGTAPETGTSNQVQISGDVVCGTVDA